MKLYDLKSGTNPRKVRIFLAEKKINIETVQVDWANKENESEAFLKKNPMGKMPVLELDDGTFLSESLVICKYLEKLYPDPILFGNSSYETAYIEMWERRMELEIYMPIMYAFMHLSPIWINKKKQIQEFGKYMQDIARKNMIWLDQNLSRRKFIYGSEYTMADITAQSALILGKNTGTPIPDECEHLKGWFTFVSSRSSARA